MKAFDYKKYLQPRPKREPLYTLEEIADKLGIEYEVLMGYVKGRRKEDCPPPPKAALVVGRGDSRVRMRTSMYKLSEYKAWVKQRQASIKGETT